MCLVTLFSLVILSVCIQVHADCAPSTKACLSSSSAWWSGLPRISHALHEQRHWYVNILGKECLQSKAWSLFQAAYYIIILFKVHFSNHGPCIGCCMWSFRRTVHQGNDSRLHDSLQSLKSFLTIHSSHIFNSLALYAPWSLVRVPRMLQVSWIIYRIYAPGHYIMVICLWVNEVGLDDGHLGYDCSKRITVVCTGTQCTDRVSHLPFQ